MNHSLAHLPLPKLHAWHHDTRLDRKSGRELYDGADGELMPWRLQQLGLDPGYVKMCCTSIYEDLQRVCASCKSRRLCARDLARGDVESGMPSYCPGSPTIDALIVNWVL
jgi:hypothetical protein